MANKKNKKIESHTKDSSKLNSKSKKNDFAVLSFIFGILFFIPFASILAVVFGFIALHQIKQHNKSNLHNESGRGLAITGIILGFFWLLIWILILIAFLFVFITALMAIFSTAGVAV